jgi:uncharacterized protein (DUF2147 family)
MKQPLRTTFHAVALSLAALAASAGPADSNSPVGTWRTIDDKTGKTRSIVQVYEQGGELFARVEQDLTAVGATALCTRCKDERKDQPLVGLVFMRHMKLDDGEYRGGDILDPDNGSIYRCKLRLEDNGRKLKVRGFIGVSLFGRSQTWEREQ